MNEQQLAEFKALTGEIIALETAALLLSKDKNSGGDDACTNASGDRQVELVKLLSRFLGFDSPY